MVLVGNKLECCLSFCCTFHLNRLGAHGGEQLGQAGTGGRWTLIRDRTPWFRVKAQSEGREWRAERWREREGKREKGNKKQWKKRKRRIEMEGKQEKERGTHIRVKKLLLKKRMMPKAG